jgi:hypothetical protein
MVADDIYHPTFGSPRIVNIRRSIRKARTAMEKRSGWRSTNAVITIGHASNDIFMQPENTADAFHAVECSHKMHLTGTRIGKACVYTVRQEAANKAFSTVHFELFSH